MNRPNSPLDPHPHHPPAARPPPAGFNLTLRNPSDLPRLTENHMTLNGTHPPLPDGAPPRPRHDLSVPALAANAMATPTGVSRDDLDLIEQLRHDVRRLDFEPLTDEQVAEQVARWPSAAASTAIEGNPLQPAEIT